MIVHDHRTVAHFHPSITGQPLRVLELVECIV